MITEKGLGWRKLFLILTVIPCCRSLRVSIPQKEYEAASGAEITMSCSFTPARPVTDTLIITWKASPQTLGEAMESVATYYLNQPVDIAPDYEGRAFMEVDQQVSTLRLTKLTVQDSRTYQCSVMIPKDDEGTTADITSLLVLVPPSQPICRIQGEASYFHNISLTCMSEEGSPQPAYEWKTFSVKNIPRSFPAKTTEKNGVLSLFNISMETSGFFICTSTNQIGSSSCNLTLAVTPGSMNIGSTAGIIVGVLAGVLLLGIVVYCCCKKKGKQEEYAEGSPGEAAFYDRDAPEAGEQYFDDKSKGDIKQVKQHEEKNLPESYYSIGAAKKLEDDQQSYYSSQEKQAGKGSDVDSRHYQEDQHDRHRGSRDRLDDEHDRNSGRRDRIEDERSHYSGSLGRQDDGRDRSGGSRDRLDDQRDRSVGSRDRLDENRDRYKGSQDRLDDQRDRYRGSQDRLDDQRDRYRGSQDRLDDQRDRYRGSQDRLDDQRDRYRGSQDRLDEHRDRYGGSRDRLDDRSDRHGGSRDRLDNTDDRNGSRY
ncbi:cell surface A33 antigen-like [Eleginops maclovinus]|uniref:cell surface A33 antigen-like n=1 Tax=Eleginops maclovinus TaxID=56733 RepID=UPI003080464A